MSDIILESITSNPVSALTANLHAHVPLFSDLPGVIVWDDPELLAVLTDLDPSESCVYRAAFAPEQANEKIEQVLHRYRSHGCLPMYWQVGPSTLPADLGKHLQALGFSFYLRVPGMAIDLQDLDQEPTGSSGLVIEQIKNATQLTQWVKIVAAVDEWSDALRQGFYQVFESRGLGQSATCQLFLGIENGQTVATSRLICAGGVAGIYHVATLPEARGRGYGTRAWLSCRCPVFFPRRLRCLSSSRISRVLPH
jgi:ribosomal protein S18 acetylase RimI-like enzyme